MADDRCRCPSQDVTIRHVPRRSQPIGCVGDVKYVPIFAPGALASRYGIELDGSQPIAIEIGGSNCRCSFFRRCAATEINGAFEELRFPDTGNRGSISVDGPFIRRLFGIDPEREIGFAHGNGSHRNHRSPGIHKLDGGRQFPLLSLPDTQQIAVLFRTKSLRSSPISSDVLRLNVTDASHQQTEENGRPCSDWLIHTRRMLPRTATVGIS